MSEFVNMFVAVFVGWVVFVAVYGFLRTVLDELDDYKKRQVESE